MILLATDLSGMAALILIPGGCLDNSGNKKRKRGEKTTLKLPEASQMKAKGRIKKNIQR